MSKMGSSRPAGSIAHAPRRPAGQGLVEFALVLPIVLVVACSLVEYAWMYYNIEACQHAANTAARFAAVGHTNAETVQRARDSMLGMPVTTVVITVLTPGGSQVTNTDRTVGNSVKVECQLPYNYLSPLPQILQGVATVTVLHGTSRAVIESSSVQ